jgi:ankyrin
MWNDAALVAALKKQGLASTTPETSAGWTPLHVAARFCTLDAAKALLAVGASVSAKDATGGTPLHLAAEMGHATAITLLLGKNASPAAVNTRGMTPLHVALLARRVDTVKQLLTAGGTLNYRVDGWTPLMVAVNGNDLPMVKFLLSKSVDVNAATGPKFGALYFKDGNLGAEKVYRTVPFGDMTALHVAAISDQRVEVARALLTAKTIKIDAPARNSYTPLHYAAAVGSTKIAKLLCANTPRAAVNAKTKEGNTPLALATANKWTATAAVLKGYEGK